MIDTLVNIDKEIFIAIHTGIANPVLDGLMPILRDAKTWTPLYLFFVV
ncbi:MAG: hypothetical protein ACJAYZ_001452, partial [Bacteroidia bacterium]